MGEKTFLVNLRENDITQELISVMPLKTKLIGEKSLTTKLELSTKIEITNMLFEQNEIIEGKRGDIMLFKGKELIISNDYLKINNHDGNYIKIGSIEQKEEFNNTVLDKKKKADS